MGEKNRLEAEASRLREALEVEQASIFEASLYGTNHLSTQRAEASATRANEAVISRLREELRHECDQVHRERDEARMEREEMRLELAVALCSSASFSSENTSVLATARSHLTTAEQKLDSRCAMDAG